MYLDKKSFENIVKLSPIPAIDLCILNEKNEILLGKRINPPAKKFFFVPGGRIRKGETLFSATNRILRDEINFEISEKSFNKINLLGIFQHFYEDNFTNNRLFSTHYVVIAYSIPLAVLNKANNKESDEQHEEYIWYKKNKNKNKNKNISIHPFAREYLNKI